MLDVLKNLEAFNALFKDESQRVRRLVVSNVPPVRIPKVKANKPAKPVGIQTPAGSTVPHADSGSGDPDAKPGRKPDKPGTVSNWADGPHVKEPEGDWSKVSAGGDTAGTPEVKPSVNIDKPVEDKPAAGDKKEEVGGGDKGGKKDEGGKGESGGGDGEPPDSSAMSFDLPEPLPPDGGDKDKDIALTHFAKKGISGEKVMAAKDFLRRFDYDFTESRPPSALRGIARRFNAMGKAVYAEADIANGAGINGVRHSFDLANKDLAIMADKIRRSVKDTLGDIDYRVVRKNWTFQIIANTEDQELVQRALDKAKNEVDVYGKGDEKLRGVSAREPKPGKKKKADGVYLETHNEKLGDEKSKEILEDRTPLRMKDVLTKSAIDEKKSKGVFLTEAEHTTNAMLKAGWSEKEIADNKDEITPFIEDTNLEGYTPSKGLRENATDRLIEHVKKTGKPGTYVGIDIHNLGGLTNHFESQYPEGSKEGRIKADEKLQKVAGYIRDIVSKGLPEGASVDFFRYGGDEIAIVASGISTKDVLRRVKIASLLTAKYAKDKELSKIEHSKGEGHAKGFGFTFAVSPVTAKDSEEEISGRIEKLVDAAKKGRRGGMAGSSVF